ncbi:MAG: DUF58 domain-containing protein [Candidatus Sericytochromatia bacterium]|nr:DUF58 domain-containing protein [Candidatus Sericytochromatia bacterium]
MTSQAWVHIGVAAAVLLAAYQTQAGWLYVFGSAAVAVFLAAWGLVWWNVRGVRVLVGRPEAVEAGGWIQLPVRLNRSVGGGSGTLTLLKPNQVSRWYHAWYREALVPAGWSYALFPPASGGHFFAHLRFEAPQRGIFPIPQLFLQSVDAVGLVAFWRPVVSEESFVVFPRVFRVDALPWLAGVREAQRVSRQTRLGWGEEVKGVREYRPGDTLGHIHWKTSARLGRLQVKETEKDIGDALCLWIDRRDVGQGAGGFEHLIEVVAAIVAFSEREGLVCSLATQFETSPADANHWVWLAGLQMLTQDADMRGPQGALAVSAAPIPDWQSWASGYIFCPPPEDKAVMAATRICRVGDDITQCLANRTS